MLAFLSLFIADVSCYIPGEVKNINAAKIPSCEIYNVNCSRDPLVRHVWAPSMCSGAYNIR